MSYQLLKTVFGESRSYFRKEGTDQILVVSHYPQNEIKEEELKDAKIIFDSEKYQTMEVVLSARSLITRANGITDQKIEELSEKRFVLETYQDYLKSVEPVIKKQKIPWMEKLVMGDSEKEAVLYHDHQMVLAKDMVWRDDCLPRLHVLAIVTDSSIRSIRDLTTKHLLLLEHMYQTGTTQIEKQLGIPEDQLKAYFHYHPSYWWLHLHFSHLNN